MSKIPGPDRFAYRFVAGHPLDGHYRTDARFFRAGRKQLSKVDVRRWSYLPGWQRSVVRLGLLSGLPAAGWQYWTHPTRTLVAVAGIGALVALYAAWRVRQAYRRRQTYRAFVRPLHAVLAPLLGLPSSTRATDYITIPPTFRTKESTPALVRLPEQFAPSQGSRELVTQAVLPKLGLNEDNTDVSFRFVGRPVAEFKMAPQPPDKVMWADSLDIMNGLEPGEIFVGLGARNKPYIRDFRAGEVVHGGFNVQTGFGKSSAAMSWIAQALHSHPETTVSFVDPKQSALPTCLSGVWGYQLANDPDNVPAMWDLIIMFEAEMDRRRARRLKDPTLEFPLMYLYLDELSEFADLTAEYWDEIREKGDKKTAPIWRSIARIMRMGREFGCRVIVFTQRLDTRSTGGFGLRDLLGWRGLGGFRKNHWMMLIGTTPIPRAVNRVGRWIYSDGTKELWVQNVYGTSEQLRDYASEGRRPVDTQAGHSADCGPLPREMPGSVQWDIIGLQAAADYLDIPVGTFRKRRQRAEGIPGEGAVGRSPAWMKAHLDAFAEQGVKAE